MQQRLKALTVRVPSKIWKEAKLALIEGESTFQQYLLEKVELLARGERC